MDDQKSMPETSKPCAGSAKPWYTNRKYRRYWKHHAQCTDWFRNFGAFGSTTADRNVKDQQFGQWCKTMAQYHSSMAQWMQQLGSYYRNWYQTWSQYQQADFSCPAKDSMMPPPPFSNNRSSGIPKPNARQTFPNTARSRNVKKRKSSKSSKSRKKPKLPQTPVLQSPDSDSPAEDEVVRFEMEITDEMKDFFVQSAKHRKERDERKKPDKETEEHRDLGQVNSGKNKATVLPPTERPGLKRTQEMKKLYGKGAAMIHGMETAMQLNYDRNCDIQQSRPWPQLPINIKF